MIEQGSAEWHAQRIGKVTASRVADVIAKTKTGWGAMRFNYMADLIAERLTGTPAPSYQNDAMRWGQDTEPQAKSAYEFYKDCDVIAAEFVPHPSIANSGASPDGYVGEDGIIEVKCPNTATHIDTLLGQTIPDKYIVQMQWQMACTGRKWCDFMSFDPRMPESMRSFIKRVERDDARIAELEGCVIAFLFELDSKVERLRARYDQKAAA